MGVSSKGNCERTEPRIAAGGTTGSTLAEIYTLLELGSRRGEDGGGGS